MIEKFMTAKLRLSGHELVLFSILWKESDKGQKIVEGDYKKLSEGMNVTIPTMYNSIKKLQERGYVEQVEKGLYQVNVKVA
jgi:Fe2+ or Zn2+ uptake regulation protein